MDYIYRILKKELKVILYNKKVFITTIISELIIFFLIAYSRNLFEPFGFHSIEFVMNLAIVTFVCQLLPQSYFCDKETGVDKLLVLAEKFRIVCLVRIILYSFIMFSQSILINFIFSLCFEIKIFSSNIYMFYYFMNYILISIFDMIIMLITDDKSVSMYISFVIIIPYILFLSYLFNYLNLQVVFLILFFLLIFSSLLLNLIMKKMHKVY